MVVNKKCQVAIYSFMLALTIIILALAFAYPIWEASQNARNETIGEGETLGLNCSNSALSYYDKAACITTDLTPFYFIGILLFAGGVVLVAKLVFD